MNLIAAVDNDWGIGYRGNLLFSIPEDMQYFKKLTENKVVVMGRRTLQSLPNSKILKNRVNIVLSSNSNILAEGAVLCDSIEHLMTVISQYASDDVFVIGGQTVYEQLINFCAFAYITKINTNVNADKHCPNIDKMKNWALMSESSVKNHNGLEYVFTKYINNSVNSIVP